MLLGGTALALLAASAFTAPALAANYTVSTESELIAAISAANASGDPSSTITITNNITISNPAGLGVATAPITINTGAFSLTGAVGTGMTGPGGDALRLGGPVTIVGAATGGNAANTDSSGIGGIGVVHNGGTISNSGQIVGGVGGNTTRLSPAGRSPGAGGAGMSATGSTVENAAGATITGGAGGSYDAENYLAAALSSTGAGGAGIVINGGSLENAGTITGGAGGIATNINVGAVDNVFAGRGGTGAIMSGGTHASSGTIKGGAAGVGMNVGASGHSSGGIGVELSNDAYLLNSGLITGADGLAGGGTEPNTGSSGGVGAVVVGSTIENQGSIIGGNGAASGNGASAVAASGGSRVINSGIITAGQSGGGVANSAIRFTGGGNVLELRDGFVINGNVVAEATDTLALGGLIDATFDVLQIGSSAQYRGFGVYEKTGTSTWTLTGSSSEVTPWTLSEGTLSVSSEGNLGSTAGDLTFNGGVLQVTGTAFTSTARAINWGANGGGFDIADGSNTFTVDQTLSGGGPLTKLGAGSLILTGDNSYSGGTTISAGMLQLGDGGMSGSITGDVVNNGTLTFNRSNELILGGAISGGGAVNQIGTGTTILTGTNTYSGGTTISAGGLQLGDGGMSGSILGDVVNNGTLSFNRSNDLFLTGAISGSGAVNQIGTGTTILTGTNTYTGGTTISAGTLQLGNGGMSGSITGDVVNNGALSFNRSNDLAFAGVISGSGAVNQIGTGTTTLTGTNTYTGGTTISAGTLQLGNGGMSGSITGDVVNNGTLSFNRSDDLAFAGFISGSGAVNQIGTGTTTLTGTNTYTGGTTISAGTLQLGNGGMSGSITGDVANNGILSFNRSNELILGGAISGSGAVNQIGTGTTILTGTNTYTGGTTISAGTLQLGNGGMSGSITGDVVNNGALAFNRSNDLAFAGAISGSGAVNQIGAGTTTLTGTNTYSGTTKVENGILAAGAQGTLSGASAHVILGSGALALNGFDQTILSLENAGIVRTGGAPGTQLTVTGDYVGAGGTIYLNTALGGDLSATDQMLVGGDTSGLSSVRVTNVGGSGAQTVNGIKIIDVAGNSDATFGLLGDYVHDGQQAVVGGAYAYKLYKNGKSDPTDGNWYLRSELISPVEPPKPLYQPGVPTYEAYPQALLGMNGVSTLQQRVGNRVWAGDGNALAPQGADPLGTRYAAPEEAIMAMGGSGLWGRVEGLHNSIEPHSSTSSTSYDETIFKLQAGLDGMLAQTEYGTLIAGATVHHVQGQTNTSSIYGDGKISADGYGFGGTLSWYGEDGFYLDGQGQVTWYRSDLDSTLGKTGLTDDNHGFGYALSLEGGKRIALDPTWSITPQVQLVYSSVNFDDFTDVYGAPVSLDRGESLQGRLGLTLDHESSWQNANGMLDRAHVYGIANLYYEFLEGTQVDVAGVSVASQKDRLWGGVGLGGSHNWNDDKYSIFGEALVNTSLTNFGGSYSLAGTAGFRVKW